jgi:glucose-1-phosphate cytidylyltransferase
MEEFMKVIILAGGLGTRISEETDSRPKPMVLIDDKPIIWHLMNIFAVQGFKDFVIALGYRGDVIKRWLLDLNDLSGDIEIDISKKNIRHLRKEVETDWIVSAVETGLSTQTGGRIRNCMNLFPNQRVIVTYGDGLANINVKKLIEFHKSHGKMATVTAVRPPARFGHLDIDGSRVAHFGEKLQSDAGWINGGFFVLEPEVVNLISSDEEPFEAGALPKLVQMEQLMAFHHDDFWKPMDTLREKQELGSLAQLTPPPWLNLKDL